MQDLSIGINVSELDKPKLPPIIDGELDKQELEEAKKNNKLMSAVWKMDPSISEEIKDIAMINSSAYGMFASIPIICKGSNCAYKDVCMVSLGERILGRRCPMEIATIISRFEMWCAHFNIDISNDFIDSKDAVDASLIKDLVNIEVQMMRAENKIALNADFMHTTLLEVDKKCNPYYGEDLHPATTYLMTLQQRKDKILNQLHATRKDLAADRKLATPSDEAIKLFKQIKEMQMANDVDITDVEFDEEGNIIDTTAEEVTEETSEVVEEIEETEDNETEEVKENEEDFAI